MPCKSFWDGKNVLITGGSGFAGSHLIEKLVDLGANPIAFARFFSEYGRPLLYINPLPDIKFIKGDVRYLDSVLSAIEDVDVIFHLAAHASVPYSFLRPLESMDINVTGVVNLLYAATKSDVEAIVFSSSSEIYGTAQYVPIDEKHPLDPRSPYAASKIAGDRYCLAFYNSYGLPCIITRTFNMYGPRQFPDSVVQGFINKILVGEKPIITGDGTQSRDFTYVKDAINAWLDLVEIGNKAHGKCFNVCTGKDSTINELLNKIIELSGNRVSPVYVGERLCEVTRLIGDNTKLKNVIEFNPVPLEKGLAETIEWTKNNLEFYNPPLMGPTSEFMEKYYIGVQ